MKKEFKLEKVLDFRNRKLDGEKAKMRELVTKEQNVLLRMVETAELMKEKQAEMENDRAKGLFDFTSLYIKFLAVKENEMKVLQQTRNEILHEIEIQKAALKKALNDVKIMEKLKEKHLLAYIAYLNKIEEKNIDEVNITRRKDEKRI